MFSHSCNRDGENADLQPGSTRIDRLHHIGSHSPYLAVDAYRLAIAEAKKSKNVDLYARLVADLNSIAPDDPAALLDTAWAEKKTRETRLEQERLEHELKSYKNNLIKESIRVCVQQRHGYHSWLTEFADGQ